MSLKSVVGGGGGGGEYIKISVYLVFEAIVGISVVTQSKSSSVIAGRQELGLLWVIIAASAPHY